MAIFMTAIPSTTHAADGLVVYNKADKILLKCQLLNHRPKIVFTEDGLCIESTMSNYGLLLPETEYTDISRIALEDVADDEVQDVKEPQVSVPSAREVMFRFLPGNEVAVEGVGENARVRLVSVDGKTVQADMELNNGSLIVHLGHLPRGIYILQVDNKSFKLLKK